jgi:uncharacterized protein (DUF1810 family)
MADPHDLQRFVDAQEPVYDTVRSELRAGRKRSHWMWFVFPQLSALGRSATAQRFGISGRAEAQAFLAHPVLGPRLRECSALVAGIRGRTAEQVFGFPDDLKLRSSMTLFAHCSDDSAVFLEVLETFYDGREDPATVQLLAP